MKNLTYLNMRNHTVRNSTFLVVKVTQAQQF